MQAHRAGLACFPQSLQFRSCGRRASVCAKALVKGQTVTNEDVAAMPWAQPGWRDAWCSQQPESVQQAVFFGAAIALLACTYASHTVIGPWICDNVPLMDTFMSRAPYILGPMFVAAGVGHFTNHDMFCSFYPPQGAWGLWRLPGSPSFHVNWTGVAEIFGGAGLLIGALKPELSGLESASAWGLFLLTYVVTPSNFYMWSHNAPGPLSVELLDEKYGPGKAMPANFHVIRGLMQVFLLSTFLGLALQ